MEINVKNREINIVALLITVIFELVLIIGYIYNFGAVIAPHVVPGSDLSAFIANLLIRVESLGFSGISVLALLALILGLFVYDASLYFIYGEK